MASEQGERRVVITGIGLVTPLGVGLDATWSGLINGASGAAPITLFDAAGFATRFACEVKPFDPSPWVDADHAAALDRCARFGLVAAVMAAADAGLEVDEAEAARLGVVVGSGLGGVSTFEATLASYRAGGLEGIPAGFIAGIDIDGAARRIADRLGAAGPSRSLVSACSSSAHAVGEAFWHIRRGDADVMVAGGAEAAIGPLGIGGFGAMRALSTRNDDPARASRPFDAGRDGFVMAEGAGMLVLEEHGRARRRGAEIYAEVLGYGLGSDAHHITAPSPDGAGARRCMERALQRAGLRPERIVHINAHGTSTRFNDQIETEAIKAVFGEHARRVAISSTKSMTGHMLGAAGGVETAITALAVHRGVVPPTINQEEPDPACDLDYTPNHARELEVTAAMTNSFGFGGTNAVLVLGRLV